MFYGKPSKMEKNLKIFGEIGIKMMRAQVHHEKLNNKGNECFSVGYEDNHPQDAYRVLDLKNKTIMLTQDARWLGKTYGEYFGTQGPKSLENTDAEDSDDEGYIILKPDKGARSGTGSKNGGQGNDYQKQSLAG
jgi:hypothetical protein